jgi:alpha-L-rhamnosidase
MIPTQLVCEYLANPIGIDTERPRFSWVLESDARDVRQSAYQILVAGSENTLDDDVGDYWDSGIVESDRSVTIAYGGSELVSAERCWWKVRVWDQDGHASDFSPVTWFEMGLLEQDCWGGVWIGADEEVSAPLLRKEISLGKTIERARVYVSGIGYHELHINGERVGDHVLDPVSTNYNRAGQPIEQPGRVLYVTHDVTDLLKTGTNAVGVMLGNGWFDYDEEGDCKITYGDRPRLLLQVNVEYTDGTRESIVSNSAWKTSSGPITANDIYNGEKYDARLEKDGWTSSGYDDTDWNTAIVIDPPGGVISAQMLPPIKVVETIKPVAVTCPADGVYIFDMGQHFAGWARLRVTGEQGTEVTLRHAGVLHEDGTLDTRNNWDALATDTYIARGDGEETWEPRFTFHGYRYVEVTGYPCVPTLDDIDGRMVRTAVKMSGDFECSNELINRIHGNIQRTFASSYQGLPQDAAERNERHGWLGDPGFVAEDYMLNFDDASFWSKWLIDIRDAQTADGRVPVVSPIHAMARDIWPEWPAWYSTYPIFTWLLYQHYGDDGVLSEHYDGIRKLVDHLSAKAEGYIIPFGLGDHMEPQIGTDPPESSFFPKHTPPTLTSTAYYYHDTRILADAARILGKTDDTTHYRELAEQIKDAFNAEFYDRQTNQYATGSQTSNALPLYLGLVPEEKRRSVAKNVADDVLLNNDGHLSTGIIGTNALAHVLPDYGFEHVMYGIVTKSTYPGWGYSVLRGATTLWECFEGSNLSLNMKMFGSIDKFFYANLAGIRLGAPGYSHIIVKPCIVGDLRRAKASIGTVRGVATVAWELTESGVTMDVIVPANATAKIHIPMVGVENVAIEESGRMVWHDGSYIHGVDGIHGANAEGAFVTFDVGSGSYGFSQRGA